VQLSRSRLGDLQFLISGLSSGRSFFLLRDEREAMHVAVRRLLEEERIDIIHVDQLNMMQFVPPEWRGAVILDAHNAVWLRMDRLHQQARDPLRRWLLGREARLIRSAEAAACRRADVVLAVSEQDRAALRAITDERVRFQIVPIAVDTEQCNTVYRNRRPQPNRLLTIGTMFSPPNSEGVGWWLREGYMQLRALCPEVTYDIVGPRPPSGLRLLAARRPGVRLHGYVADSTPFWAEATALAVPLLAGGGVRVKLLEAMVMGVPVISTSIGCEGLAVKDREHLLVADTPEAFARACAELLSDTALASYLAANARQLALERYDAPVALAPMDTAYEQALTSVR
jgi:glycosyltransferase involved in cell wall biosynthesis